MELGRLHVPHYFARPSGLMRWVRWRLGREDSTHRLEPVRLPWRLSMLVDPADDIGRSIAHTGVFDPAVTEAIYRLLDPGERAVDVGANVGYVTSLMSARSGAGGEIYAYEVHPDVFRILELNASIWSSRPEAAALHLSQLGVSDRPGVGTLEVPPAFARNTGLAKLSTDEVSKASPFTLSTSRVSMICCPTRAFRWSSSTSRGMRPPRFGERRASSPRGEYAM